MKLIMDVDPSVYHLWQQGLTQVQVELPMAEGEPLIGSITLDAAQKASIQTLSFAVQVEIKGSVRQNAPLLCTIVKASSNEACACATTFPNSGCEWLRCKSGSNDSTPPHRTPTQHMANVGKQYYNARALKAKLEPLAKVLIAKVCEDVHLMDVEMITVAEVMMYVADNWTDGPVALSAGSFNGSCDTSNWVGVLFADPRVAYSVALAAADGLLTFEGACLRVSFHPLSKFAWGNTISEETDRLKARKAIQQQLPTIGGGLPINTSKASAAAATAEIKRKITSSMVALASGVTCIDAYKELTQREAAYKESNDMAGFAQKHVWPTYLLAGRRVPRWPSSRPRRLPPAVSSTIPLTSSSPRRTGRVLWRASREERSSRGTARTPRQGRATARRINSNLTGTSPA